MSPLKDKDPDYMLRKARTSITNNDNSFNLNIDCKFLSTSQENLFNTYTPLRKEKKSMSQIDLMKEFIESSINIFNYEYLSKDDKKKKEEENDIIMKKLDFKDFDEY